MVWEGESRVRLRLFTLDLSASPQSTCRPELVPGSTGGSHCSIDHVADSPLSTRLTRWRPTNGSSWFCLQFVSVWAAINDYSIWINFGSWENETSCMNRSKTSIQSYLKLCAEINTERNYKWKNMSIIFELLTVFCSVCFVICCTCRTIGIWTG